MMKKFMISALILALCISLCACAKGGSDTAETESPATQALQLHTIAPTEAQPQLEWCPVEDCKLSFDDSDGVTALNEKDILMFALDGTDDNAKMIFKLSDEAKEMMEAAKPTESFTVKLNDEEIGTAYFSETKEELTLSGVSFERLCDIASTIRGLK